MTIKPWKSVSGLKIKVGNQKANMALKMLDMRIRDCEKILEVHIANRNWGAAGPLDNFNNGLRTAFNVMYQEFNSK